MKKILLMAGISTLIFACGGSDAEKKTDSATKETAPAEAPAAAAETANNDKAIELIAGSDCLTCHKVNEKVIGPSYTDVAKKYEATDANIKMLADKVINGGSGVWGEIAMAGHPQISEDDAKTIVKYILSLKNQ
ncbi:MAG TPA: c-type cytochrome [Flavihumibacter sp.]|nr:c-type cytochrome [Bacteroidota bacterium]HOA37905.1 c-type cytochrome [Flavihumibacter sp.]HPZ88556.1 c-type cytochrome [Flavihumibacter sp.]HQD09936.1 c-type cytochrome [Flavihumibacter sp.]